jgi:hypothetical protein
MEIRRAGQALRDNKRRTRTDLFLSLCPQIIYLIDNNPPE